ncbi:MAG TPA: glycosyltransferase family 39 protein, partial [Terriglobia bacterium]|nr:glycosyltransferase family 39 protein [Terriglobia bacterium]
MMISPSLSQRLERGLPVGAFTVWLLYATVRYGATVLKTVAFPLNAGLDKQWLITWLIIQSVMAFCLWRWRRSFTVLCTLHGVVGLAILTLSGALIPMLFALWIVSLGYVWGVWLLRRFAIEADGFLQSIAIAVPTGLAVPVMLGFVLGSIHWLTSASLSSALVVLTLVQLKTILSFRGTLLKRKNLPLDILLPIAATLPLIVLNLTWAVAPEIHFDANNYHLAVPKAYLASGGFVNLPYFFTSYFVRAAEMIFTFGFALGGPATAKLISFLLSLVAAICVFAIGEETFDTRVGAWAAAYFYAAPIVVWLSGTAYIDNVAAMFVGATVVAFIKWYNSRSPGWIYVTAALMGMTVATKLNGAYAFPVFAGIICWNARRLSIRRVAIFLAILTAVALPWYALTYYWTGNPVFPFFNGFFKSPFAPQDNRFLNAAEFGIGTSIGAVLRMPFRLVFNTDLFREASPRGTMGNALLLALPFSVVLLFQNRRKAAVLLATVPIYFVLWAYTFQYARYFVALLPIICVLGVATFFYFDSSGPTGRFRRVCLWAALIVQFASVPVQFWNIPERFPVRLAFGRESRADFLKRALAGYDGAQYLNSHAVPGERIIGIDVEQTRLYLNAPLESFAGS